MAVLWPFMNKDKRTRSKDKGAKLKALVLLILLYFIMGQLQAQERLKGRVVDAQTQEPLAGATIKVKETNSSTISNSDGYFELNLPKGDYQLSIIYLSYHTKEQSLTIPFVGNLLISLQVKENTLQEVNVVSTGYQTLPKERATGSFTTINTKLFNEQVGTNVLDRLEAIANGVSVFRNNSTRTSQLMVRGLSTINGPTSPLIILDNFPYEGNIDNINPNDIKSITILKDAAAASIWGVRAGNGVIVINTKTGSYGQALKIQTNTNLTIGNKPNIGYLQTMTATDYIDFEKYMFSKGYYNSQISSNRSPALSPVVDLLARVQQGVLSKEVADQQINEMRNNDVRDEYEKYMYQRSVNQQYYLNVSGGNNQLAYVFATGYDENVSNLADNFSRLNLRSDAMFNPIKNLQLNVGLTYTASRNHSGKSAYGAIVGLTPYQLLKDQNDEPVAVSQTYSQQFKETVAATGQFLDWNYYPLTDDQFNYTNAKTQDVMANFSAKYDFNKALNFTLRYQHEKQTSDSRNLYDEQSYFSRNLINSFTQINGSTVKNIIPNGGILDQRNGLLTANSFRAQLNFDHTWRKHNLVVLTGYETREIKSESFSFRTYGYNNELLTGTAVDYLTLYPNYVTKINARIPAANGFSGTLNRFVSLFANGAYTFSDKYIFSASIRRDASNLFGVNVNDKWTPLWSTGLSWLTSKEHFYTSKFLPYLKLSATYGYSGNVDPSKSAVTTIAYGGANNIYTNTPFSSVSNFYNPDLRWEKLRTINIGLDFKLHQNRVAGSVAFYLKSAKDLYASVPIDYTTGLGVTVLTKNVADMVAKGVDVELNTINIDRQIRWTTHLNLSYYQDRVGEYYLTATNGSSYLGGGKNPIPDYPVWGVYGYQWAGLDATGNPQGYLNGELSQNYTALTGSGTKVSDLQFMGARMPKVYGSIGNTITYKNFTLTARLTYGFGHYIRRQSINYTSLATLGLSHSDYANRWQDAGDEQITNVPAMVYPLVSSRDNFYTGAAILVEKGDYLRFQYLSFGYQLVKENNKWLPLKNLQAYVNANNLGLLWRANKLGIDPDFTGASAIPNAKNIAIGLSTTF